uniref:vacuolar protein sorting-associated protein 37B-like n=1 Tax=Myxine glutinosa TaxID=7769 RepID=UPI00358F8419
MAAAVVLRGQSCQLPEALMRKLSGLSIQELMELLENESKLDQMILETDEVKNLQVAKELCLASNRSLAEVNLQHQPQLESGRVTLANKYQQLGNINERYVDKRTQLDGRVQQQSAETVLALLQAEGATIEEETEAMSENLLEGRSSLDTFLDTYQNKRQLAHNRRIKIEKLQEILRNQPHDWQSQSHMSSPLSQQGRSSTPPIYPARPAPMPPGQPNVPGPMATQCPVIPGARNTHPWPNVVQVAPNVALNQSLPPQPMTPFPYPQPSYGHPSMPMPMVHGQWGSNRPPVPHPQFWPSSQPHPPPLPPRSYPTQIGFAVPR